MKIRLIFCLCPADSSFICFQLTNSRQPNAVRKKMKQLGYIVSSAFIILGIIGIIVGIVRWEDTKKEETRGRLGIIIDAGGSGTRLYLYEYKKDNLMHQIDYLKCEDKGLTTYASNPGVIKDLLVKCLEKAEKDVPQKARSSVPLNMQATAGMRVLKLMNESAYNKIFSVARNTLSKSGFNFRKAETMKGSEEAINSWATLNYLKEGFKNNKLNGALEMGSTSLQVSFIPAKEKFNSENTTVTVDGKPYTVYVHSYLCYGRTAFERRYLAKLVMDSGYSKTVNDPCSYIGQEFTKTSEYLWAVPCCSGQYAKKTFGSELNGPANQIYTFKGQSNFTGCQNQVKRLFNTTKCTHESCSFNDVSQPPVHGDFVAFSAFYYPVNFLNLSSNVNLSEYQAASKRICSLTAAEAREIPGSLKFAYSYCLSSVFAISFLTKGIHFNNSNWNIDFTRKINGQSISWTLGYQYLKKDQMSAPIFKILHQLSETEFALIMAICSTAILVGILIVVIIHRRRSKNQRYTAKE